MRTRAYLRLLAAAVVLTLVATTLAPDVAIPFLKQPHESQLARDVVTRIVETIARPPDRAARLFGIWIDSHSAQLWPPGWPIFTAYALRVALISIPFWFAAGVVLFEIARFAIALARRVAEAGGATPSASR